MSIIGKHLYKYGTWYGEVISDIQIVPAYNKTYETKIAVRNYNSDISIVDIDDNFQLKDYKDDEIPL